MSIHSTQANYTVFPALPFYSDVLALVVCYRPQVFTHTSVFFKFVRFQVLTQINVLGCDAIVHL
jgi:hypothetical protein